MKKNRCSWASSPIMIKYHDKEWGKPIKNNDPKLFEMLTLEGAQAGLSWAIILNKREGYRELFSGFDPKRVARFSEKKAEKLLRNPKIVRNRLKVHSTINNAKAILQVQKKFGSFSKYIWKFVDGKPIVNQFKELTELPAQTDLSKAISKDLKKRGFRFVGPTVIYAFMQAVGLVNDHLVDCFRYKPLQ